MTFEGCNRLFSTCLWCHSNRCPTGLLLCTRSHWGCQFTSC